MSRFNPGPSVNVGVNVGGGLIVGMAHQGLQHFDRYPIPCGGRRHRVTEAVECDARHTSAQNRPIEGISEHGPRNGWQHIIVTPLMDRDMSQDSGVKRDVTYRGTRFGARDQRASVNIDALSLDVENRPLPVNIRPTKGEHLPPAQAATQHEQPGNVIRVASGGAAGKQLTRLVDG